MSAQTDTPVHMRNPQPSQFHLIARDHRDAGSHGGRSTGSQFTPAPAQVHPLLRKLLQQPYEPVTGQGATFIQVEPELQSALCAGLESMCTDVAEWSKPNSSSQQQADARAAVTSSSTIASSGDAALSPPDALAWTSTLPAQQAPMDAVLSSVISSWARVQRVGDGLGSVHTVTKQIHQLERECERYAQQRRMQTITRDNRT